VRAARPRARTSVGHRERQLAGEAVQVQYVDQRGQHLAAQHVVAPLDVRQHVVQGGQHDGVFLAVLVQMHIAQRFHDQFFVPEGRLDGRDERREAAADHVVGTGHDFADAPAQHLAAMPQRGTDRARAARTDACRWHPALLLAGFRLRVGMFLDSR
jgi:hypothetical protein